MAVVHQNWRPTTAFHTTTPVLVDRRVVENFRNSLIPGHARIRFRLCKHLIGSHVRRSRRQHLLFAVNQITGIETCQLKSMAVRNRIRRTSLYAIAAKYASIVVDVVDMSVAFGARNPFLGGVFRGFYVDAIGGAGGGTEETGHTLFQSVFVTLQHMHAAKAFLKLRAFQGAGPVGIVLDDGGLKHLLEGDGHPLSDGSDVFDHGHVLTL